MYKNLIFCVWAFVFFLFFWGDIIVHQCLWELGVVVFLKQLTWAFMACELSVCTVLFWNKKNVEKFFVFGFLSIAASYYFFSCLTVPARDGLGFVLAIGFGGGVSWFLSNHLSFKWLRGVIIGLIIFFVTVVFRDLCNFRNYYHGSRWVGLWDNPNTYGMLMGAGLLLSAGFLVVRSWRVEDGNETAKQKAEGRRQKLVWISLLVATFMMSVGLVMSYSRGAWLATAVALAYLDWCYGKLKWRYVAIGIGLVALSAGLVWGRTPDSAPWFVKRADLARPSAQHRVSAWRAGFEIMWDHPVGVGWNNVVRIYAENYNPPAGEPEAIATNDYLMIGTELGIPALLCFVIYAALCLRGRPRVETGAGGIQAACRAGAIVFLVAFWFDGGLFKLPTAALFWVLLELGAERGPIQLKRQKGKGTS